MGKHVLMVGFHFPPSAESSGHLRFLGFTKYLPHHGWAPIVLASTRNAYSRVDPASVDAIPAGCDVYHAFALDTRRHLGIFGKYPAVLAQPDRWASWWPAAVCVGLRLIRRYKPRAIWSTYPIMTAHCVAYTLGRLTGLPWVADFRDPVRRSVELQDRLTVRSQHAWERRVANRAAAMVFTTPGAERFCAADYPEAAVQGRLSVIPNGYDESDFSQLPTHSDSATGRPLHFVHNGVLYRRGRDPAPFFEALAKLRDAGLLEASDIRVTLRGSGSEAHFRKEIDRFHISDLVTLKSPVPYRLSLTEQAAADALLLFQGSEFDTQVPAKAYEYLRIGRPIFALVGAEGDTASLLRSAGGAVLAPLDNVAAIQSQLLEFIRTVRAGHAPKPSQSVVAAYSRDKGAAMLADLLDRIST